MNSFAKETLIFIAMAVVVLPLPTLALAWLTGQTIWEVLYR
jgi:hypothetical protein